MDATIAAAIAIALTTIATMVAMARSQPWQNVITSFVLISAFSIVLPDGLAPLPRWVTPIFWSNVVLNSRGVAKLLLRRSRSNQFYGYGLIAIAALLSVVPLLSFARSSLPIWFASAIILQLLTIPWLIEKKPVTPPPNSWPLVPWTFLAVASFAYARWHATQ